MRQHGDAGWCELWKMQNGSCGVCSNLDKPGENCGRSRVPKGLKMPSGKKVVLFQVFATRPEVVTTHFFQGIVEN